MTWLLMWCYQCLDTTLKIRILITSSHYLYQAIRSFLLKRTYTHTHIHEHICPTLSPFGQEKLFWKKNILFFGAFIIQSEAGTLALRQSRIYLHWLLSLLLFSLSLCTNLTKIWIFDASLTFLPLDRVSVSQNQKKTFAKTFQQQQTWPNAFCITSLPLAIIYN